MIDKNGVRGVKNLVAAAVGGFKSTDAEHRPHPQQRTSSRSDFIPKRSLGIYFQKVS